MMGLIVLTSVSNASAAVIQFTGILNTKIGTGGALNLSVPQGFFASLQVNDSGTNNSTISSGFFSFGSTTLAVSGGQVNVTGGNQIDFVISTANTSPAASIAFAFSPVAGLGTGVNQGQLNLLEGLTAAFVMQDGGSFPIYLGDITAVPEPGTMLALAGLVSGFGGWHYRRRRLAKKA